MSDVRPLAAIEIESVVAVLGLARLHQGDGFYLVAWRGNDPLGHAHLALTEPPELQDVEVRQDCRRRGVASDLVAKAEDEARSRGFDRLRVGVSIDNAPAQALYRQHGYVDADVAPRRVRGTINIRTGPIEVDDTVLVWEKRLARRRSHLPSMLARSGSGLGRLPFGSVAPHSVGSTSANHLREPPTMPREDQGLCTGAPRTGRWSAG